MCVFFLFVCISINNSSAKKKLTINPHERAIILLISPVRSTSETNKIYARERNSRPNNKPAVESLYNSETALNY